MHEGLKFMALKQTQKDNTSFIDYEKMVKGASDYKKLVAQTHRIDVYQSKDKAFGQSLKRRAQKLSMRLGAATIGLSLLVSGLMQLDDFIGQKINSRDYHQEVELAAQNYPIEDMSIKALLDNKHLFLNEYNEPINVLSQSEIESRTPQDLRPHALGVNKQILAVFKILRSYEEQEQRLIHEHNLGGSNSEAIKVRYFDLMNDKTAANVIPNDLAANMLRSLASERDEVLAQTYGEQAIERPYVQQASFQPKF